MFFQRQSTIYESRIPKTNENEQWIQEWISSWNGALISYSDLDRFRHLFIDCWIYVPIISLRKTFILPSFRWLSIRNFMEGSENFYVFSIGI